MRFHRNADNPHGSRVAPLRGLPGMTVLEALQLGPVLN